MKMKLMPKINLCFLWHMHQPFYKDLVTGDYRLPWTRLHALKDYYGMVKILEDFPEIRQTFNLVPSLLTQIEDYSSGKASDPFLQLALKPAEELESAEKEFILKYFFQVNEDRVIRRYPRYAELFGILRQHERSIQRAAALFDIQMFRDLQVLSQLAWFDEYYLEHDAEVKRLAQKGRDYNLQDQAAIGCKENEALGAVLDVYRAFAHTGQIEISTSAYYHPILPLLCDSNVANVSHPYVSLPAHFTYPQDAEEQLQRAYAYLREKFGVTPNGMWPSEGSVSDATLSIASKLGFKWTASDEGVLSRTLGEHWTADAGFHSYLWRQSGQEIRMVFRDRHLSDLIGFVYSRMDPAEAARHFVREVRRRCAPVLKSGRDALVPIIMDGENAWEAYARNGRPFLRELYSNITRDSEISAVTMTAGIKTGQPRELKHIFPGSWIDGNFDMWIGSQQENIAWEHLREARRAFDRITGSERADSISREAKRRAWEEILIAEGSDWCWWYGPEHSSANKPEFDQLYRDHLTNMYRLLGEEPPAALAQPIVKPSEAVEHDSPKGLIQPTVDGLLSSRAEWADAGRYRLDPRSGAMHRQRPLVQDLYYGSDGQHMYFRVDVSEPLRANGRITFQLRLRNLAGEEFLMSASRDAEGGECESESELSPSAFKAALGDLYEARVSLAALHARMGDPLFLHLTVLRNDLPVASIPASGELELQWGFMAAYAF